MSNKSLCSSQYDIILKNIKKFENNPKVLCKWNWFLTYFEMEKPKEKLTQTELSL